MKMKIHSFTLAMVFTFLASQASAQIADPDQRMRWFNLQRLAIETNEIEACQFFSQRPQVSEAYYQAASETAASIEAYIARYPRAIEETPDAYRYRVWGVTMRVCLEKARKPTESVCQIINMGHQ